MSAFEELVFERTTQALASIREPDEMYAVSMFVYDTDDDPRYPTVTIGYNTVAQWSASSAGQPNAGRWYASDSAEAKWNYAFWLQNRLAQIPDDESGADAQGSAARRAWLDENGLWLEEDALDAKLDADEYEPVERITQAFVRTCVAVAKRLHAEGIITAAFGRPIPVIVHELEYYDEIAEQTREANPPGLADEFVAWIQAM